MKSAAKTRRRKKRVGVPPGTLIAQPEGGYTPARRTLFEYDKNACSESLVTTAVNYASLKETAKVSWLNIDGIQDSRTLEEVGAAFGIHPLVLEDIQSTDKRPKIESYDEYLFMIFKMLRLAQGGSAIDSEQVSLILGKGYVLSFQEKVGDVFDYVRDRLRNNKGRVRKCGADYLAYSLIDAVVDNYFEVVEAVESHFEELEERVVYSRVDDFMPRLHLLRDEYLALRRAVRPLREMIHEVLKEEQDLIEESTTAYFRDVYDHILEVTDAVDSLRDALKGLLSIHDSQQGKQLNSRLNFLTIVSTLFIPPTFLVGVYGMNFHYMPELSWRWAYPAIWAVMVFIGVGMLIYFRRKKWF